MSLTPELPLHHRAWPRRLPHRIEPPATSLWFNLQVSATRYPDKPALVFFDRHVTYAQLQQQAEAMAAHLRANGVQDGDRVLLYLQNCPQWICLLYTSPSPRDKRQSRMPSSA